MQVAILARVRKVKLGQSNKLVGYELEPIMIRPLNACFKHPKPVYFDEDSCPCCAMEHERLTSRKEPR